VILEHWNGGILEGQKNGIMEKWNVGRMGFIKCENKEN
jgi:hypothetical protein